VKGPKSPHLHSYTLDQRYAVINPQGFGSGDEFTSISRGSLDVLEAEGEGRAKRCRSGLHCRMVGRRTRRGR